MTDAAQRCDNRPVRRTLMCKNVEVASFAYDSRKRMVVGKARLLNPEFLPVGCHGNDGRFNTASLGAWISARGIPPSRPGLSPVLVSLGLATPEELLVSGLGLSLSDQYWFRPPEEPQLDWERVNFFHNDFSTQLGEALAPHDPASGSAALHRVEEAGLVVTSSPDAALNGNLPKRWEIAADGTRVLVKSGKASNLYQEPFNEAVATALCRRLLDDEGAYVPYRLQPNGYPAYVSTCPCMVDANHELVIAGDVMRSHKADPSASRHENYALACESHGLADVRTRLAQMLVVDHILANFDRHWGNFGVVVETDTRRWVGVAPIYDSGESLWCDRALANDFGPYSRSLYPMPFLTDIDAQLGRYVSRDDLAWFDPACLAGFVDEAVAVLEKDREVAGMPGRLEGIAAALERRIAHVEALAGA
jgi:hypothetical protein